MLSGLKMMKNGSNWANFDFRRGWPPHFLIRMGGNGYKNLCWPITKRFRLELGHTKEKNGSQKPPLPDIQNLTSEGVGPLIFLSEWVGMAIKICVGL